MSISGSLSLLVVIRTNVKLNQKHYNSLSRAEAPNHQAKVCSVPGTQWEAGAMYLLYCGLIFFGNPRIFIKYHKNQVTTLSSFLLGQLKKSPQTEWLKEEAL